MEDLYPWTSPARVDAVVSAADDAEVREWLAGNWNRDFLSAEPDAVRRLLPYMDLARIRDRAALVLYAVEHDWVDVLEAADGAACGFLPAFWRDAFNRARTAGSVQCIAWLLANKGELLADARRDSLEL